MRSAARRIPALLRRGGRSPVVSGGGVAPTITVAPVLTWTGGIGSSPVLTDPVYTGDPGTITWTYYRDGVPDGTINGVNKATAEAYVAAWSGTTTGVNDNAVSRVFRATVTNGSGSAFADSNAQEYDSTVLVGSGGTTLDDLVLADGDTTVDQWGASIGSVTATTLSALSASTRLAYSATGGVGGRPLATADGATDVLRGAMTKSSAWATAEIGVVGAQVSDTQGAFATFIAYGNTGMRIARNGSGGIRGVWTNQVASAPGLAALAVPTHWSADGTASSTLTLRSGGSSLGTATAGVGLTDGFNVSLGGFDTGTANNAANWAFQAWYLFEQLTTAQRLDLRALLTARTGIAC